ncbi:MAG: PadR family transcriptional regulator [Haloglomus sp.]
MTNENLQRLLHELAERDGELPDQQSVGELLDETTETERTVEATSIRLDRSFASEYLDELIIAILLRHEEANGMDIIREFGHLFGVQFSPGTVYPHLHSLEEEGVLECRECVQTKEYRIADQQAARAYLESTLAQLSCLSDFLDDGL